MNHWFPWIIAVGNMTSIWLTTRGRLAGFWVLIGIQAAFIVYSLASDQVGFIFQNVGMIAMGLLGVRKWMRDGVHRDARQTSEQVPAVAE